MPEVTTGATAVVPIGAAVLPVGCVVEEIPDAALAYRTELGLGTFPVDRETKKPRLKRWQAGGLRSEASIAKVFGRYTDDAVVGIPCGQRIGAGYLYVLDVDERHGGAEALAALPGPLPETATARTPNGWHYWFATETPQPTVYRPDQLELKGAGAFVVVPPGPGRYWLRDPFEFDLAACPDFLLSQTTFTEVHNWREQLHVMLDASTGEVLLDLCDPLERMRAAKPGSRHRTLLQTGGQLMYRVRHGLVGAEPAVAALREAALSTGLPSDEVDQLIAYLTLHDRLSSESESVTTRVLSPPCLPLNTRDLAVLEVIVGHFERLIEETRQPFENQRADIFSLRYLCRRAGIEHPQQVKRSLGRLLKACLVWKSPVRIRLKQGQRPCDCYRPTYAGFAACAMHRQAVSAPAAGDQEMA